MLTNLAQNVSMSTERRDAVIDAAYRCFLRYGVRRTTMDDIATEAGMSRPAVYQHVANKNAAFRLVAERLFGRALEAAQTAAAAGSDLNERLFLVLETKLDLTLRLFRETPHAAELLDESVTLTGDLVSAYTRDLVALVATTLRAGYSVGVSTKRTVPDTVRPSAPGCMPASGPPISAAATHSAS